MRWSQDGGGVLAERSRGRRGIYSGGGLGEGLGLGPISVNRTAAAGTVSRADSPSVGCS
jgi:hypothetical protein